MREPAASLTSTSPPPVEDEIRRLRAEIDRLDRSLLALLRERGDVVVEIARLKRLHGLRAYDPAREEAVVQALTRVPPTPFSALDIRQIFQAIFRACLRLHDRDESRESPDRG